MIFQEGLYFSKFVGQADVPDTSGRKIFLQALGVAVSNPKAIVFLTALFPQFISIGHALVPQFTILIATLMSFSFFFLMGYALLAHSAKNWLTGMHRIKAVNRTSGSIFIGFGFLLAPSSNK
ncbi:MAG: LysE family transporter [Thermodesulfobacteriota bacterium]